MGDYGSVDGRVHHEWQAKGAAKDKERFAKAVEREGTKTIRYEKLYLGIAAKKSDNGEEIQFGFCTHDATYTIDFAAHSIKANDATLANDIAEYLVTTIRKYQKEHDYKFMGAGVTKEAVDLSPHVTARLWADLDIVPLVFDKAVEYEGVLPGNASVDEQADSMARKCLMYFGPTNQPFVQVGFRSQVAVDVAGHARLTYLEEYKNTVGERTWEATMRYAKSLKEANKSIAWFSATPQGGGVALMRHADIRFLRELGVHSSWYVPRPKNEVFRITKTNHNILQGVAEPHERLLDENINILDQWIEDNANRFWLSDGGPLSHRSRGGASIVVVDDPQMPLLVSLAKKADPDRPVVYRSHIQVRADLVDKPGSPTAGVWEWLYGSVKAADVFISHPVRDFVPSKVDFEKVGYMPATTDWLDGLNKKLSPWDSQYYMHEFNNACSAARMATLAWPSRKYIAQIARFDPSKGIPDVIASYGELRRKHMKGWSRKDTPQLVIAGHGSIDDPDGSRVLDETLDLLEHEYDDIANDVVVQLVGPQDQILNALLSNAHVALQLSTREGFEVKVSEALHKGKPVIATQAGGIPLQVEHGRSGFLVQPGDSAAVAEHLHDLFTDETLYRRMSEYAAGNVSDEVGTVGGVLCWMYLADALTKGEKVRPDGKWIYDLARAGAGMELMEWEKRLPRRQTT